MKIELTRVDNAYNFKSTSEEGHSVLSDGSVGIGGANKGMRPMEMVLAAMASCSSIDVVMILKKQRQNLEDIKVQVTGNRATNQVPAVFTDIHIHFQLFGDIKEKKAIQAVTGSMEKYCSVSKMLEPTVKITHSHEIINLK